MNLILKQVALGIFTIFVLTIIILVGTFFAFPLENWRMFWSGEIYPDVPYLIFITVFVFLTGTIAGLSYGWYMKKNLKIIETRLEELNKNQPLLLDEMETSPELKGISKQMRELENKYTEQAELSQRIATERAEEREKSLQEVVIQERNRLARELHDSVSQQLFAASMMMSAINEGNSELGETTNKQLAMVEKMIDQSQLEMRALLLHLRPIALKEKTLEEGIEELLLELRQKVPMDISWKVESILLEKGVEDHLFRILQEAVSNALRHSKAKKLQVLLIKRDDNVIMRISDDGIGFNMEEERQSSSYGLKNMQERALEISGSLKVVSVEGQGTRLEVKVPHGKRGGKEND